MPWCCGFCSRWNLARQRVCPYCGRPRRGRICRRCKEAAPRDATFCPSCGNDTLTEAGTGLRLRVWQRLTLAGGALLLGRLVLGWLTPWVRLAVGGTLHLLHQGAMLVLAFWVLTAALPRPWGQGLRRAVGILLRFFGRVLIFLVR